MENQTDNDIWGSIYFLSFKQPIILNRNSSPKDFEFTTFDCIIITNNIKISEMEIKLFCS